MPRLFALDHNFPQPIVDVLAEFQVDAELVRIDQVHPGMPDLDDWEVLLAHFTMRATGTASSRRTAASSTSRSSSPC